MRYLSLVLALALAVLTGCVSVNTIPTGPEEPSSYFIRSPAGMPAAPQRGLEVCPTGFNITSHAVNDNVITIIIVCKKPAVPAS